MDFWVSYLGPPSLWGGFLTTKGGGPQTGIWSTKDQAPNRKSSLAHGTLHGRWYQGPAHHTQQKSFRRVPL